MPNKKCTQCEKDFEITNSDLEFYKRIDVDEPKLCPKCRHHRRTCFRNEKNFFNRECDLCKKKIVAIYPTSAPFPVYCNDCFWGDKWEPLDYGQDVDYNKPFFEQWKQMADKVPHIAMINSKSENSDYTNYSTQNKNCYMCAGTGRAENCYYCNRVVYCKECVSCFDIYKCELCYECIQCTDCYTVKHSEQCFNSNNLDYCYDCQSCGDCFGCVGLRGSNFCILNKEYEKEEYQKKVEEYKQNIDEFLKQFEELKLKVPRRFARLINCERSTGNHLENCVDVNDAFMVHDGNNLKYIHIATQLKDAMDITVDDNTELSYEICGADSNNSVFCSNLVWFSSYAWYCRNCFNSKYLFGCVSLKKNNYCILNKDYGSEEAFETEKKKIVEHMRKTGEWGQFFPHELSPFAYNESIASLYFPMKKEEVEKNGWLWREDDTKTKGKETIKTEDIPDITKADDSLVKQIFACTKCETNYKILKPEFDLHKSFKENIPTICPHCRNLDQIHKLDPLQLWHRKCMKQGCNKEFASTYAPERKEIVYCEECYKNEVY